MQGDIIKVYYYIIAFMILNGLAGCANSPDRYGNAEKYVKNPTTLTIYSPWISDPRLGIAINSGRQIKFMEFWETIPFAGLPAKLYYAIIAATGEPATQYTFNNRLDSLGSKYNVGLAKALYQRGIITTNEFKIFINKRVEKGDLNYNILETMYMLNMFPMKEMLCDDVMFRRWSVGHGISSTIYDYFLDRGNSINKKILNNYIAIILDKDIVSIMPETILCAEKKKIISHEVADAMLRYRFYCLYQDAVYGKYAHPGLMNKFSHEKIIAEYRLENAEQLLIDLKRKKGNNIR